MRHTIVLLGALLSSPAVAQVSINEIRTGSGNAEYFEFKGAPGTSMAGMTFLILGDGTSTGTAITRTGVVEWIYRFAETDVIGSNGYLVLHNPGQNPANAWDTSGAWPFTVDAGATDLPWGYQASGSGLAADTQIESPDNMTFMLVRDFSGTDTYQTRAPNSGAGGQDLDTNDDGVLDITPWSAIIDSVAFKETNGAVPAAGQDWWYSPNTCGPYVSRTVVTATIGTTVAGWDFQTTTNSNGGTAAASAPNTPKRFRSNAGVGTMYLDGTNGSSDWVQATELNALTGSALNATGTAAGGNGLDPVTAGTSSLVLVGSGANGKSVSFKFSMAAFQGVTLSYATRRSTTGFNTQQWAYSTNGTDWTDVESFKSLSTIFTVKVLATLNALDSAADAYLKCTFSGATTATSNNRLDNVLLLTSPVVSETIVYSYAGPTMGIRQPNGTWFIGASSTGAGIAQDTPGAANYQAPTDTCGDPNAGDCAVAHGNPFCADACCCVYVGGLDPFCTTVRWDAICVTKAADCAAYCSSTPCPADITLDRVVTGADLGLLLVAWGTADADITGDGIVNGSDLGALLNAWGACP